MGATSGQSAAVFSPTPGAARLAEFRELLRAQGVVRAQEHRENERGGGERFAGGGLDLFRE